MFLFCPLPVTQLIFGHQKCVELPLELIAIGINPSIGALKLF
jgi:hypothetical protein